MKQVFFVILLSGTSFMQAYARHTDHLHFNPAADIRVPRSAFCVPLAKDTVPQKIDNIMRPELIVEPIRDTIVQSSASSVPHKKDSVVKKKHDPRRATIYSAILPGAGQIYNRKYWKVPIVYAAVGIPVYAFFFNKTWYAKCQYALVVTVNQSQGDSLARVDPILRPFVSSGDVNGIITNRDSFRKNEDYSVLFFFLFYGLNIVDATVDAHLRDFNVNDDLSFKIKPLLYSGPNLVAGLSLVFDIHKGRPRPLNLN
jgi:hypothetical protein